MTYQQSENPGRPYGSRPEDDESVLTKPRHGARLPWLDRVNEEEAPKLRASEKPYRRIPGGPAPETVLPCSGRWLDFDGDDVTEEAARLCASCPFQAWCLETATANNEHGIWAGTSWEDRRNQRKEMAA